MALNKTKTASLIKRNAMVVNSFPESVISEQFRTIQANINFSLDGRDNSQIFLITSPSDGEGKSTVVTNLAISMAQQKKKVILIDANLRNPTLHSIFKKTNSDGLTDVLTGALSFEEAVIHTGIWRLDLLTRGLVPNHPVELFGSSMMKELLKKLAQQYDVILIDSNAVLEVTDTKLLASQCDGVILIIKSGKTKLEKAIEAKRVLEFARAKIVGTIMNQ